MKLYQIESEEYNRWIYDIDVSGPVSSRDIEDRTLTPEEQVKARYHYIRNAVYRLFSLNQSDLRKDYRVPVKIEVVEDSQPGEGRAPAIFSSRYEEDGTSIILPDVNVCIHNNGKATETSDNNYIAALTPDNVYISQSIASRNKRTYNQLDVNIYKNGYALRVLLDN